MLAPFGGIYADRARFRIPETGMIVSVKKILISGRHRRTVAGENSVSTTLKEERAKLPVGDDDTQKHENNGRNNARGRKLRGPETHYQMVIFAIGRDEQHFFV